MSYVRLVNLREDRRYPGRYLFNLSVGDYIINGFGYYSHNRSLQMPRRGNGRIVKATGAGAKRLRALVESAIASMQAPAGPLEGSVIETEIGSLP
jgi:hypothetical protein